MSDAPISSKPKTPPDPRVRMAAERTLLAWVRTGIALMGFGFVVARFTWFLRELNFKENNSALPATTHWSLVIGIAFMGLGIAINVLAGREHGRFLKRHDKGDDYVPPTWSLGIVVTVIVAMIGFVLASYLVLGT